MPYLGRLAPSPTGYLHLGHARTFWVAWKRAQEAGGEVLMRNDDLDRDRCRPQYAQAMLEDLRWLGLTWREPMVTQSERMGRYRGAMKALHALGLLFPCSRSRKELESAVTAPHDEEPVYPKAFRPDTGQTAPLDFPATVNWRLRVPDGERVGFVDGRLGPRSAVAGEDFGDILVWRKDDLPSYQLACAVDDGELGITEVVRGEDLVTSTFRQLVLQQALGLPSPAFYHTALVLDGQGQRLAKRADALSLRSLRDRGISPESICGAWEAGESVPT